ncbi:MAG: hypothetical protein LBQ81_06380 [Zoogloeaceae bacterium]|jgi:hypothetical protein|nr:hypothetical protein [Zoogloeaceae bacterium]
MMEWKSFLGMALSVALLAGCGDEQKDDKPLAQKAGEVVGAAAADFTKGVASSVQEKVIGPETEDPADPDKRTSTKVGEVLGGSVSNTLGTAIRTMDEESQVTVELDDSLKAKSLTINQAKDAVDPEHYKTRTRFTAYLVSDKDFKGTLLAKAFDGAGTEIGRSRIDVDVKADDAGWVDFDFPAQMTSTTVKKLQFSAK